MIWSKVNLYLYPLQPNIFNFSAKKGIDLKLQKGLDGRKNVCLPANLKNSFLDDIKTMENLSEGLQNVRSLLKEVRDEMKASIDNDDKALSKLAQQKKEADNKKNNILGVSFVWLECFLIISV